MPSGRNNRPADLTPRQHEALIEIEKHITETQRPPTIRELAKRLGGVTSTAAHIHLRSLEKKGYILREPFSPRNLQILKYSAAELPLKGEVQAGGPVNVWEIADRVDFSDLLRAGNQVLTVSDDSLESENVDQGDCVIGGISTNGEYRILGVIRRLKGRGLDISGRAR